MIVRVELYCRLDQKFVTAMHFVLHLQPHVRNFSLSRCSEASETLLKSPAQSALSQPQRREHTCLEVARRPPPMCLTEWGMVHEHCQSLARRQTSCFAAQCPRAIPSSSSFDSSPLMSTRPVSSFVRALLLNPNAKLALPVLDTSIVSHRPCSSSCYLQRLPPLSDLPSLELPFKVP